MLWRLLLDCVFRLDFGYIFELDLSSCSEYCELFPHVKDHLSFPKLRSFLAKGRYEDGNGRGVMTLFDDLQLMINRSKLFNQSNSQFQPWRCADMMDKALLDLKWELGQIHGIQSLTESAELTQEIFDAEEEELHTAV